MAQAIVKCFFLILCWVYLLACSSTATETFESWSVYRGDHGSRGYSSLDQINRGNVDKLTIAWQYSCGDGDTGNRLTIQCNPILANNLLYVTSPRLQVIALDPGTGREIWKFNPFEGGTATGVNRGVTYWEDGSDRRILFSAGYYLYALNANDGTIIESFGNKGKVDLRVGLGRDPEKLAVWATSPGIIHNDILIQGSATNEGYDAAPGFIRAYHARTGELVWTFHTIPQPGEPGHETWDKGSYQKVGGANAWAGMSLDNERGIVYIPTGSPAYDFYGGNRKGDNLFGNCLIALKAATGERLWHYQIVHHDLWDYDLPAPPTLVTVVRGNQTIDAVAQVTKMGMVFLFDRETGEPLFPIEERAVPQSRLVGEQTSKTQPFPVKPPPFVRQFFDDSQITDISRESYHFIKSKIGDARMGPLFTPPDTLGTIQLPGTRGGAEWGGASVDPATGILYVNANEAPLMLKMNRISTPQQTDLLADVGEKVFQVNNCASCHGADRRGNAAAPSLLGLSRITTPSQITALLRNGKGQMPSFPNLTDDDISALLAYLFESHEQISKDNLVPVPEDRYAHDGWNFLYDEAGYPGIKPPWGTLNAIDLNRGEILWQVTLGEYPELTAQGVPATGTMNLGGPIVTKGGLIFIGATKDEKFRAFDKRTGEVLWEHQLPAGGYATPATYEWKGEQYVVIAAGGGGKLGTSSGDYYVAFKLAK